MIRLALLLACLAGCYQEPEPNQQTKMGCEIKVMIEKQIELARCASLE